MKVKITCNTCGSKWCEQGESRAGMTTRTCKNCGTWEKID